MRKGEGLKKWAKGLAVAGAIAGGGLGINEGWKASDREDVEGTEMSKGVDQFRIETEVNKEIKREAGVGRFQERVVGSYMRFLRRENDPGQAHVATQQAYDALVKSQGAQNEWAAQRTARMELSKMGMDDDIEDAVDTLSVSALTNSDRFGEYVEKKVHPGFDMGMGRIGLKEQETLVQKELRKGSIEADAADEASYSIAATLFNRMIQDEMLPANETAAVLRVVGHDTEVGTKNGSRARAAQSFDVRGTMRSGEFRGKLKQFSGEDVENYVNLVKRDVTERVSPHRGFNLEEAKIVLNDLYPLVQILKDNPQVTLENKAAMHAILETFKQSIETRGTFNLSASDQMTLDTMMRQMGE